MMSWGLASTAAALLTMIFAVLVSWSSIFPLPATVTDTPVEGLSLLFSGNNATVDIVLIHGLNGHRERTWTASNGVLWPRDLLPHDLPGSRVYSWGYDARLASKTQISLDYIHDHARHLVSGLSQARIQTNTTRRPIIFLAHSLGGIVAKRAMLFSDGTRHGHLQHLKAIKLSTRSIYFFGTPHQGGNGVTMATMLLNIGAAVFNTNSNALQHLARDSEYLQLLSEQFLPLSTDFEIKYFYEKLKTELPRGSGRIIVDKASAVLPGTLNAEVIGIHADHRNMVRFPSREDAAYQMIAGHLVQSALSAVEIVESTWKVYNDVINTQREKPEFNITFPFPHHRNPYFVGRQEPLQQLRDVLRGRRTDGQGQFKQRTAVLSGIGGIGKTQLIIEYIYSYRSDYTSVLWVESASRQLINASFVRFAHILLHGRTQDKHRSNTSMDATLGASEAIAIDDKDYRAVSLVLDWLSKPRNDGWLLIFDSYDNIEEIDIQNFMPPTDAGHIIISTRRPEAGRLGNHLPLDLLPLVDSVALLLKSARQNLSYDCAADDERVAAESITERLGNLPLALDQAGAYIYTQQIRVDEYLPRLHSNFKRVSSKLPKVGWPYGKTILQTWEMSLDAITSTNPAAVAVLTFCSFLGPELVTIDILKPITDYEPSFYQGGNGAAILEELSVRINSRTDFSSIQEAIDYFDSQWMDNSENLSESLALLFSYSFLKRRGADGISIHPLVQLWAKERLDKGSQADTARDVIILIAEEHRRRRQQTSCVTSHFSRHFYLRTVRCRDIIEEYLRQGLATLDDPALLLSVEQIAIDLVYSGNIPAAADLVNLLLSNPRSEHRAYCIHISLGLQCHCNSRHAILDTTPGGIIQQVELFLLAKSTRNAFDDYEALIRKKMQSMFETDLWPRDPILTPIVERQKLLQSLANLEKSLESTFCHRPGRDEELLREIHRLRDIVIELGERFGVFELLLRKWANERGSIPVGGLADWSGHLMHPIAQKALSKSPPGETIRGTSVVLDDFTNEFIFDTCERLLRTCWDVVRILSAYEKTNTNALLKAILVLSRNLYDYRFIALPLDHASHFKAIYKILELISEVSTTEERIRDMEWALVRHLIAHPDPGPVGHELKWIYLSELAELYYIRHQEQGIPLCFSEDLKSHVLSALQEQDRIKAVQGLLDIKRSDLRVIHILIRSGFPRTCENTSEDGGILRDALQWYGWEDNAMEEPWGSRLALPDPASLDEKPPPPKEVRKPFWWRFPAALNFFA